MSDEAASDQAARERAVATEGSVLVQAPAGSGKTTLLVLRYLTLLSRVDAPERILALTFTRRAAEEMRERVLQALAAAREPACPPAMSRTTWLSAVRAVRHLDEANLDVERQPSRLRIETIDAFNAWLAGQLPIASGAGSGFQVVPDARPYYEEAARRTLAHEEGGTFGDAVHRVLALDDQRWRKLVRVIAEMLAGRDRWLPLLAGRLRLASALDERRLALIREHLDEDLRMLVSRVLLKARDVLGAERISELSRFAHAAAARLDPGRPLLQEWRGAGRPLETDCVDLGRWRSLASLLLTAKGEFRKRFTTEEGFPPECADKVPLSDLLRELERDERALKVLVQIRTLPEALYTDDQWERVRDVAQVMVLAAAELDQVFREEGCADFAAVSMAALRSLGAMDAPSDLALRLDYRLQHILVDEFQDTSSAQLELARLLTAGWEPGDGRSIFCVGDPMQSIYGFRQAEVRAFLELAEEGLGGIELEVQRLTGNFRSATPVVEWVNASFAQILPRADDRERGAIAFRPSVARSGATLDAHAGVGLHGYASRAAEAAGVAAMIAAQSARHPDWRIAVLVRARTHARDIAAALRAGGIAFRAVEIEPLQDRSVVRDVIMLSCALTHLGDRTAWLALLRAPWAGVELADLLQLTRGAPLVWSALADAGVLAGLSEDGRLRCLRVRGVLESAFRVRAETSFSRWVERTWLALGGPAVAGSPEDLSLAAAAFARLRELERRGLPDPADLPAAFADLYADHGTAGAVEIMTIHKAKGLEFDMVVVPCLDRHVPHGRDRLLETHQFARHGRDGMAMAARPAIGAEKDRLFEFLRHQIRDSAQLEAQRLLYVACTRAKSQLRLTAMLGRHDEPDTDADEDAPPANWRPRAGSLLSVLWRAAGRQFSVEEPDESLEEAGPPRGGPLWRATGAWGPPQSAAVSREPLPTTPVIREETPVFDWVSETARRLGILVHAELRTLDPEAMEVQAIRAREPHYRRWLASHGVPEEHVNEAAARVVEALAAIHGDERGRWILRRFRDDGRERALSGYVGGAGEGVPGRSREISRVVFDRSFVDEHGIRWIIDYKTSRHAGGGVEEFLDREVERYRPQLARYASLARHLGSEPVRVALYFPLMRAWREWEP